MAQAAKEIPVARIGTPDEVMTSENLSELYRTPVDVLRVRGQIVVVGAHAESHHCAETTPKPEVRP